MKNYSGYARSHGRYFKRTSFQSLGLIKNRFNNKINKLWLYSPFHVKLLLTLSLVFIISIISFIPTISSDVISMNSGGSKQILIQDTREMLINYS